MSSPHQVIDDVPETPMELMASLHDRYPNDSEAQAKKRFAKEAKKYPHIVDAVIDDVVRHIFKHKIAN